VSTDLKMKKISEKCATSRKFIFLVVQKKTTKYQSEDFKGRWSCFEGVWVINYCYGNFLGGQKMQYDSVILGNEIWDFLLSRK